MGVKEQKDIMEKYYYCTKKIYFKAIDILKMILESFDEHDADTLTLTQIYEDLQEKLHVKSVNKANLKAFLCDKDEVKKEDVEEALQQALIDFASDSCDDELEGPFDPEYHVTKTKSFSKISVFNRIVEIFDEAQKEQLHINEIKDGLANKLGVYSVNVANLKELLRLNKPYVSRDEVMILRRKFTKQAETNREEIIINQCRRAISLTKEIHVDNLHVRVAYLTKRVLAREFESFGVERVADIVKLDADQIHQLVEIASKDFLELLKVLSVSINATVSNDFYKYVLQGANRTTGKKNGNWTANTNILYLRAKGETFEEAGRKTSNLSRQRAEQIEKKHIRRFETHARLVPMKFVNFLRMNSNNPNYITKMELFSAIHQCAEIYWYFMKNMDTDEIAYVEELDMFAFVDGLNWYDETMEIISSLPSIISEVDIDAKVKETQELFKDLGIDVEIEKLDCIFKNSYRKTGTVYSKSNISKQERYKHVMKTYFPDGFHMYDNVEMEKFRKLYKDIYKDDNLPEKDRAIRASAQRVSVLVGRGIYVVPDQGKRLISQELFDDICNYIDQTDRPIFMTNTIFYLFKERLLQEGINNKYALQGAMKKYVGNKYFLSRDYISKNKDVTTVRNEIVSFLKDADRVVTKQELFDEFPGVPDSVLAFALADEDIIVGIGTYAHRNYIDKFTLHLQAIAYLMKDIAEDGEIHNCQELFDILKKDMPAIISEIKITDRYFLFSMIEDCWADKFAFSRPFFAKLGTVIGKQDERIVEFVTANDETEISALRGFINENSFVVDSILELINNLSESVIFKNKDTLIRVEDTGLNEDIQGVVDVFLDAQIGKNKLPSEITDFKKMPEIGIEWNEWVLYSVVKKWSKKYSAVTTSNIYTMAEPRFVKTEEK